MNRFGTIIIGDGYGRREGVIISGTPKPGTCMTMKAATAPVNGKFTFEVFNRGGDGARGCFGVLLEDVNQGRTVEDAFEDGQWGMVYFPMYGDLLQMRVAMINTGTGEDYAIGDLLEVDEDTGLLIDRATGVASFEVAESAGTETGASELVLCRFIGPGANLS